MTKRYGWGNNKLNIVCEVKILQEFVGHSMHLLEKIFYVNKELCIFYGGLRQWHIFSEKKNGNFNKKNNNKLEERAILRTVCLVTSKKKNILPLMGWIPPSCLHYHYLAFRKFHNIFFNCFPKWRCPGYRGIWLCYSCETWQKYRLVQLRVVPQTQHSALWWNSSGHHRQYKAYFHQHKNESTIIMLNTTSSICISWWHQ